MINSESVKIIIWLVVLVIVVLVACALIFGKDGFGMGYSYKDAKSYSVGSFTADAEGIKAIDLKWIAGEVKVVTADTDHIQVTEDSGLSDENQLRYKIENGKVTIQYCKSGLKKSVEEKNVVITLPEGMKLSDFDIANVASDIVWNGDVNVDYLNVESVSGRIDVKNLTADRIKLTSVSGNADIDVMANTVIIENLSGDTTVNGSVSKISLKTVSGAVSGTLTETASEITLKSVSGGINLVMPENGGYKLNTSSVSGPVKVFEDTYKTKDSATVDGGYTKIKVESVSGDVVVSKP